MAVTNRRSNVIALLMYTTAFWACNNIMVESFSLNPKSFASIGRRGSSRIKPITIDSTNDIDTSSAGVTSATNGIDSNPTSLASPSAVALNMSKGGATESTEEANNPPKLIHELIAEFIGTFLIVQIGCGTVCSAIFKSAQTGLWQIAAVWSIAVTLAISVTASISGAHLNPAITFAMALFRKFQPRKVVPFVGAQVAGAAAAAGINFLLFRDSIVAFEAQNAIVRGAASSVASASAFGEYWSVASWHTAFLAEAYGTALLAFIIFAVTHPKNDTMSQNPVLIPPLIGATVGALISVIAPLTQGGFNPARDFGPRIVALVAGWGKISMQGAWLYIVAPLVGAPIGAFIAEKVLYADTNNKN